MTQVLSKGQSQKRNLDSGLCPQHHTTPRAPFISRNHDHRAQGWAPHTGAFHQGQDAIRKQNKKPASVHLSVLPTLKWSPEECGVTGEEPKCSTRGACVLWGESARGKRMVLGNVGRVLANSRGQVEDMFANWPWTILTRASQTLWQHCGGVDSRVRLCCSGEMGQKEGLGSSVHVSFRANLRKQ